VNTFEFILNELEGVGVENIYGVMGREASEISFSKTNIKYRLMRHEFSAALCAAITGHFNETPGVCMSTIGPGATNLATSMASAYMSKWPMLAIAAQAEEHDQIYGHTHQCVDQVSCLKPFTRYAKELTSKCNVSQDLADAISASVSDPKGPSLLSVPINLFQKDLKVQKIDSTNSKTAPSPISNDLILEAVNLINKSERPIIIVGYEAIKNDCIQGIIDFCENSKIPVVTAYNAKGILPHDHGLHYGPITPYLDALTGSPALSGIFSDKDLILQIGLNYAEDIREKMFQYGDRKKIIRISKTPWPKAQHIKCEVEINGDITNILSHILIKINLENRKAQNKPDSFKLSELMLNNQSLEQLNILSVIKILNNRAKDQILVVDTGMFRHYAVAFYRPDKPKGFLTDAGLSTFAFGLPSGIAAKIAKPDHKVVVLAGDGGFHASSQELESVARFGLDIDIIVINNSKNGLIKFYQMKGDKEEGKDIVNFSKVDFCKLAKANGVNAKKITSAKELESLLSEQRSGPMLFEVEIDYEYSNMKTFTGLEV